MTAPRIDDANFEVLVDTSMVVNVFANDKAALGAKPLCVIDTCALAQPALQ